MIVIIIPKNLIKNMLLFIFTYLVLLYFSASWSSGNEKHFYFLFNHVKGIF